MQARHFQPAQWYSVWLLTQQFQRLPRKWFSFCFFHFRSFDIKWKTQQICMELVQKVTTRINLVPGTSSIFFTTGSQQKFKSRGGPDHHGEAGRWAQGWRRWPAGWWLSRTPNTGPGESSTSPTWCRKMMKDMPKNIFQRFNFREVNWSVDDKKIWKSPKEKMERQMAKEGRANSCPGVQFWGQRLLRCVVQGNSENSHGKSGDVHSGSWNVKI